ncbi:uncharacterized protein L3040_000885 [Drepanopeziza brunnea f. sp. 'multigermtubi']|uniref:uncharacterized protein n=1 Tax=Drepanopeziza brunnea f. sp. 'multigermtubi' TaxID=698441 RepID=UPI0023A00EF5|nr:hypothetical protein L3040_000885 [Drepanopeziza brunnea f. sp. 'multigermtubi']
MSAIPKNEVGSTVADANADVELGNISTYSLTSTLCRPPTNFTSASTLKDSEIPQPADPARRPRLQRLNDELICWLDGQLSPSARIAREGSRLSRPSSHSCIIAACRSPKVFDTIKDDLTCSDSAFDSATNFQPSRMIRLQKLSGIMMKILPLTLFPFRFLCEGMIVH